MKKLVVIAVLIILFASTPSVAFANEQSWARIVESDTNLYATSDSSKVMFMLEKSYYVQILDQTENMFFVAVMPQNGAFSQVTGYVYQGEVELCQTPPVHPVYPTVQLTVATDSAQLKLSPVPSAEVVITATNTQKVNYYGKITSYSQSWYYVSYANKFGYVLASDLTLPAIALHPTPLQQQKPVVVPPVDTPVDTQSTTSPEMHPTTEIILIVFVALLALGITLALFLPGNTPKKVFDGDI